MGRHHPFICNNYLILLVFASVFEMAPTKSAKRIKLETAFEFMASENGTSAQIATKVRKELKVVIFLLELNDIFKGATLLSSTIQINYL